MMDAINLEKQKFKQTEKHGTGGDELNNKIQKLKTQGYPFYVKTTMRDGYERK